jgi:hypothetical protein
VTATRNLDLAPAAAALRGRIIAEPSLGSEERAAMFALLGAHFSGVTRVGFDRDLAEKSCALLLEDSAGILRGFSTMLAFDVEIDGRVVSAIYSGDTIVERGWWRSPALATTWLQAVWQLAPAAPGAELYWLLLTSGYRTYRFLPVFFRDFHPRVDVVTPAATQRLLDRLAGSRFGDRFDRATGIVRFDHPQVLAPGLRDVPGGRRLDPHVSYFLDRNPGYVRGDELACLTRIARDNLTAAGQRIARLATRD